MSAPSNPSSIPDNASPSPGWLKVDFHLHTREDPLDCLDHSALELLKQAHTLGFHALAITLHDHVLSDPAVFAAARELGILLIPAAELRLDGADVVVLNLSAEEASELKHLRDLEAFRQRRGRSVLVIAPHPFFVMGGSIGAKRLIEHIDLFDAIEISHFYMCGFDRNRPAIQLAERFQKPLLATSDAHRMEGFGDHYTLVQAPNDATPEVIFDAIRAGCVRPISAPLTTAQFARNLWWIFVEHEMSKRRRRLTQPTSS